MNTALPLPIAVLISGGGTTLHNLLERIDQGQLNVEIKLVISSNAKARGLQYASDASIPSLITKRKSFADAESFSESVFGPIREANIKLAVMGGFLIHLPIPSDFENRVMNIHPGLIPAFCGKGYYGNHVHQAVLDYGAKVSGCTVHFVDNLYDHGPVILQQTVAVHDDDSADTLAERIFQAECEVYPQAIELYAQGKLRVEGRHVLNSENQKTFD